MSIARSRIRAHQQGFTLIELIVVLAIVAVLAILAVPKFKEFLAGGKTTTVASDLQKIVTKVIVNHGSGTGAYTGTSTAEFASIASNQSNIFSSVGTGATATAQHDFGASGAPVTMAAATINSTDDAAIVTISQANVGTCPGLPNAMQKVAQIITINGTTVKAVGGAYSPTAAQTACTDGDTNTYTFTFQ